jgi:UDP-N-acetyl-D-glucosamine dehydrogenase
MTSIHADKLQEKIDNRTALVGIIGLGYVGLPLALAFTEKGFNVLGFDVDPEKVDKINRGESYIKHLDPTRLTQATGNPKTGGQEVGDSIPNSSFLIPNSISQTNACLLTATVDFDRLSEPDAILICVPTPLGPHKEPDLQYVESSAQAIRQTLRPGQLVILESTTYPGTTEDLLRPILESAGGGPRPQKKTPPPVGGAAPPARQGKI